MKIQAVDIVGVKGCRRRIEFTSNNVLLVGPMGSGKSAIIDAVRLGLNIETEHGSRNLDRLSPTGSWDVRIDLEHEPYLLQRQCNAGKSVYIVDSKTVTAKEFSVKIAGFLDVQPHHTDLSVFTGMSGQQRAKVFGDLLEIGDKYSIADVYAGRESLRDRLFAVGDQLKSLLEARLDALDRAVGEPNALVGEVDILAKAVRDSLGDARATLRSLTERARVAAIGSVGPAEIKMQIAEIDQSLGALRAELQSCDDDVDRYQNLRAQLVSVRVKIASKKDAADACRTTIAKEPAVQQELQQMEAEINQLQEQADQMKDQTSEAIKERIASLDAQIGSRQSALDVVKKLTDSQAEVDPLWLQEELLTMLDSVLKDETQIQLKGEDVVVQAAMNFAREVVIESLGGHADDLSAEIESAKKARAEAINELELCRNSWRELNSRRTELVQAMHRRSTAKDPVDGASGPLQRMEAIQDAKRLLAEHEAAMPSLEEEEKILEHTVGGAAIRGDRAMIAAQIDRKTADRKAWNDRLTEMENQRAIAGQIEDQRVVVVALERADEIMKAAKNEVQAWRNDLLNGIISRVREPMLRRFEQVFGPVSISMRLEGAGRSTSLEILMSSRSGYAVPLDLLSAGESVLAGAAFLRALQDIKSGPGTIVTLNAECVDAESFPDLLSGIHAMEFDLAIVTHNRESGAPEECGNWQVCDLGRSG